MAESLSWLTDQMRRRIRGIQLRKELEDADQQVLVSEYELVHLPRFPRPKRQVLEARKKALADAQRHYQALQQELNSLVCAGWSTLQSELYSRRDVLSRTVIMNLDACFSFCRLTEDLMNQLQITVNAIDHRDLYYLAATRSSVSVSSVIQLGDIHHEGKVLNELWKGYCMRLHEFNLEGHLPYKLKIKKMDFSLIETLQDSFSVRQELNTLAGNCLQTYLTLEGFILKLCQAAAEQLDGIS